MSPGLEKHTGTKIGVDQEGQGSEQVYSKVSDNAILEITTGPIAQRDVSNRLNVP